jgi:hypothetical protein
MCPKCGEKYVAGKPPARRRRLPRAWVRTTLLIVASLLAVPAVCTTLISGDVYRGLHGDPIRVAARYSLYGALALVIGLTLHWQVRRRSQRRPRYPL